MSTNADGPCGSALSEGLGPNVTMPEPFDYCYEWDGPYGTRKFSAAQHNGNKPTRSVPLFSAEQMHEYAGACVLAATTECSAHWQAKMDNMLAAERERCALLCETWMDAAQRESGPEAAGWLHQMAQHMRGLGA